MLGFGSPRTTQETTTGPLATQIRWLLNRDLPEVLVIEAASQRMPWDEATIKRCSREKHTIGMVATAGERVCGYFLFRLHANRIEILTMAVDPKLRRRGVGTQIIAKLKSKLSSRHRSRITLKVRETGLDAQLFFRSQGFQAIGTLRAYFEDTGEDAIRFEYQHAGRECECSGELLLPGD
jgi:ribosomal-protein-alanine acetyltransferase